ncbi:MAG: hypothetical protein HY099_02020, partial [Nitrospirae bacterium]|nr:hypothetical protein [Nitrospirota bacterium]
VNKNDMQKTIKMFEAVGFEKELDRDGSFTRFARLRKRGNRTGERKTHGNSKT